MYPENIKKNSGLHLRLSETTRNRNHNNESVDHSYYTNTLALDQIAMNWEEKITMHFDSKDTGLVFNSFQTTNGTVKEKEAIIHILKDFNLLYLKSYKLKINNKVICNINYYEGFGIKDNVRFQVRKKVPFFDSGPIPEDCK